jgi:putative tricarboxylic transport membrane protein
LATGSSEKGGQLATGKRRIDQVSGLIWLMVGAFIIMESRDLLYKDEFGPGPGFFPFWLGLVLSLLGVALLVHTTFHREDDESISFSGKHAALQMFLVMASFFAFVFLIAKTGFYLAAGLLFLVLLWAVEGKGWKFSLAVAILAALALWGIFGVALKIELPRGFFDLL